MSRSLPEMGEWDSVFDETYLRTYGPSTSVEQSREQALGAASLAEVEPGAEILDCPCGFGRHSIPLAEAGYRVTGLDRSESQLAEAERSRGDVEWPHLVRGDYRELPFPDASFDAVLTLFSSLGYLEQDEDVGVLRELRRVLRPGRALVVETASRDGFARFAQPFARRAWEPLPDGSLYLEERTLDWIAGTIDTYRVIVTPTGERIERPYLLHVYSAKEWVGMLREAGFTDVAAFGDWDGITPFTPDVWRLILRAR
jgi:ubiquinone/menaquinone biosynthesis C-methylase UbiE